MSGCSRVIWHILAIFLVGYFLVGVQSMRDDDDDDDEVESVPEGGNHRPIIRVHGVKHPQVKENMGVGEFVAFVEVTDIDDGPAGQFDCQIDNDKFEIIKLYDGYVQYEILTRVRLDREASESQKIVITCEDQGEEKKVARKDLRMVVVDVNDNPPIFDNRTYEASIVENNRPGYYILTVKAWDRDHGEYGHQENGHVTYMLTGSNQDHLTIDTHNGAIFAKGVFDYEETPELTVRVTAIDHGIPPMSGHAKVNLKIINRND